MIHSLNLEKESGDILHFLSLFTVVNLSDLLPLHRMNKHKPTVPLVESKDERDSGAA
jgi:hypothetical protein